MHSLLSTVSWQWLPVPVPEVVVGVCLLSYLFYIVFFHKRVKKDLRLPPGPKGFPIIRNLFDLPFEFQWLTVTKWAKEYGDIIYISFIRQHLVFLNSFTDAVELLEGRSSLYSDRIQTPMIKLMEIENDGFAFMGYGDTWRVNRRMFHQGFNSSNPTNFLQEQIKYTNIMLRLIKDVPASFEKHFKFLNSGIILEVVYGFKIKPENDPYVKIAEDGAAFIQGAIPGSFLVDAVPFLKYIPDWFPGSRFKEKAKLWGKQYRDSLDILFDEVNSSFSKGTAPPSFVVSQLPDLSNDLKDEDKQKLMVTIKKVAGIAFLAAVETTTSALMNFVFLMITHPDVQRKAQEELDKVIGRNRLPNLDDRESLPYVSALIKEVLRFYPVAPLGVPHRLIADDVYNGMYLPKGSIVSPNIWAMSRDERDYAPDPEVFRPERYLEANLRDPSQYVFGFGRRICPGRYLANNTLFIAISAILQLFSVAKEIPFEPHWENGLAMHLDPFPASFELRYEGAEKLIDGDDWDPQWNI